MTGKLQHVFLLNPVCTTYVCYNARLAQLVKAPTRVHDHHAI